MAKRRKQRKLVRLTPLQEAYLIFGSNRDLSFESDLQARGAWFRHRDEMLSDFIHSYPGMRPWAYWKFEWTGPEQTGRDDWMLLIEAGRSGRRRSSPDPGING